MAKKRKTKIKQVMFLDTPEQYERLMEQVKLQGKSMGFILRKALGLYLDNKERVDAFEEEESERFASLLE